MGAQGYGPARGGLTSSAPPPTDGSHGRSRGRPLFPPPPPPRLNGGRSRRPYLRRRGCSLLFLLTPCQCRCVSVSVCVCPCVCARPARPTAAAAPPFPLPFPSPPLPSLLPRRCARLNPRSAQRRGRDGGNPRAAAACAGRAGPGRHLRLPPPPRRAAGSAWQVGGGTAGAELRPHGPGRGGSAALPGARRYRTRAPGGCPRRRASVYYTDWKRASRKSPFPRVLPPGLLLSAQPNGRKVMLKRPLEGSRSLAVFVSNLQLGCSRFICSEPRRSSARRQHGRSGVRDSLSRYPLASPFTAHDCLQTTAMDCPCALPVLPSFCHHVPSLGFPRLLTISGEMFSLPGLKEKT